MEQTFELPCLLVEYYLVTLISTSYKTILYFYALIIRPTSRCEGAMATYKMRNFRLKLSHFIHVHFRTFAFYNFPGEQ